MRALALISLLASMWTAGCGAPGVPQPPSLNIPKFVGDLQAVRKGETVNLTWSIPTETTDGALIRKPGRMLLQRALSSGHDSDLAFQAITDLPLEPSLKEKRAPTATATDSLSGLLQAGGTDFAVYSVLAQSNSGKSFGLPNRVAVPLVMTLSTPQKVQVIPVPMGISISWDQSWPPQNKTHLTVQYAYRIMRRVEGSNVPAMVQQVNSSNEAMIFMDTGIEWEKHYEYWITPVTLWQDSNSRKGEVEGDDSPVAPVFAHDVFPPAAPTALQAVFSGVPQKPFIDLTWTPNTEQDLAGYNVYRHGMNEPPVKISSELVKTPAFHDPDVRPGMTYFYAVSAVDLRGNESAKSQETSETAPRE